MNKYNDTKSPPKTTKPNITPKGRKPQNKCTWTLKEKDTSFYEISCNHSFFFLEGFIKDNSFIYCPYCGKKIKELQK